MPNARREERLSAALPVDLDAGTGVTLDVSASGIFFETDVNYRPGSGITFTVQLDGPSGKLLMKCQGEIVRVEQRGEKVGVAVKIGASKFEPLD